MQLDRVRRTALAVAVLSAVGAIAASAGATATPPAAGSASVVSADGGTLTGTSGGSASGATGSTAATGATGTTGATGASGPSGATGTAGTSGSGASGTSSTTSTGGGSSPATPATTVGATGSGGIGGPAAGAAGGTVAPSGVASGSFSAPVVTASIAQPQSGPGALSNPSSGHHSAHANSGGGAANGPTAPSPALFDGSNPLAGVLPGSWDDPFIVNGAADVPAFYVQSFHIPPFLLTIYEAAGAAYGIPWQALAAINEVETDYGTDLDTSSAGAIGWMQFLPRTWKRYGVDASASGARDPYNAADAIFAAARYLAAAGGTHDLPGAIFAYNHSHAYVRSVLLRAELLAGEPTALLNSISELAEGDFPIQLRYHASYRPAAVVPAAAATGATGASTNGAAPAPGAVGAAAARAAVSAPAEDIFASSSAAVVATQDGTIVAIGHSRALGRYVVLRNAFGDRFTYGNLGSVSAWFPAPKPPRPSAALLSSAAPAGLEPGPRPTSPASAGAQSSGSNQAGALFRQARAQAAASSSSSAPLVATVNLSSRPSPSTLTTPLAVLDRALRAATLVHTTHSVLARYFTGAFGLRPDQLVLEPLRVGSHVLAGTILGRLRRTTGSRRPHLLFELRPAGVAEAPIDPRPFLDAWSQLETLELHRDSFNSPFYGPNLHADSVGATLLMSQLDIERAVLEDAHVTLPACERSAVAGGSVDRRVLAALEVLALHGIDPTVNGAWCGGGTHERTSPSVLKTGNAIAISALDGQPAGSVAEVAIRALSSLHGASRPTLSELTVPGDLVISFAPTRQPEAIAAAAAFTTGFALSSTRWAELDSRLGQIREPRVPTAISAAALPVRVAAADARRTSRHTAAG